MEAAVGTATLPCYYHSEHIYVRSKPGFWALTIQKLDGLERLRAKIPPKSSLVVFRSLHLRYQIQIDTPVCQPRIVLLFPLTKATVMRTQIFSAHSDHRIAYRMATLRLKDQNS